LTEIYPCVTPVLIKSKLRMETPGQVFSAIQDRDDNSQLGTCDHGLASLRRALMPTLICAAAACGDLAAIQAMVGDGASLAKSDYDGRTALHLAAAQGHAATVRRCHAATATAISTEIYLCVTPVLVTKLRMETPGQVQYLVGQRSMELSCRDRFGNTPLHNAVEARHIEVVKVLRAAGAVLGLPERRLASLLWYVDLGWVFPMQRLFLSAVLVEILRAHRVAWIDCDFRANEESRGLIDDWCSEMCSAGDQVALICYVAAGAQLSASDYDFRTALHISAASGNIEITKLLLRGGASPAVRDRWGRTPMDEGEPGVSILEAVHFD
jgi:hypothetical protein